mmetsp:Transcript_7669/g.23399  ORF Transcript_7669/g.23399 Transcript_7669/m.23399 type:complete len:413 (-) Transcript_7669:3040-4278(-)
MSLRLSFYRRVSFPLSDHRAARRLFVAVATATIAVAPAIIHLALRRGGPRGGACRREAEDLELTAALPVGDGRGLAYCLLAELLSQCGAVRGDAQRVLEHAPLHGLAQVYVHARLHALVAVSGHDVGGARNDGDRARRVALDAAHFPRRLPPIHERHVAVHEHRREGIVALKHAHRLPAIGHDHGAPRHGAQQAHYDLLRHRVVLRDECDGPPARLEVAVRHPHQRQYIPLRHAVRCRELVGEGRRVARQPCVGCAAARAGRAGTEAHLAPMRKVLLLCIHTSNHDALGRHALRELACHLHHAVVARVHHHQVYPRSWLSCSTVSQQMARDLARAGAHRHHLTHTRHLQQLTKMLRGCTVCRGYHRAQVHLQPELLAQRRNILLAAVIETLPQQSLGLGAHATLFAFRRGGK